MSRQYQHELEFRRPYPWDWLIGFLERRAIPGVEEVVGGAYRRTVAVDGAAAVIEVRLGPGGQCLVASCERPIKRFAGRLRRQFDVDANPAAIDAHLSADALLAPLVAARPGLRVPGAWDPFELAVRAIVGQQVSVAAATTVSGRIAERFGTPLAGSDGTLTHLFPIPEELAGADVASVGMPGKRGAAIAGFASAVAAGEVVLDGALGLDALVERLCALPGIGPWTANYIAMRGLGEADAFPIGDLGLARALEARSEAADPASIAGRAEAWRPWRAYATMHLWAAAGAGG